MAARRWESELVAGASPPDAVRSALQAVGAWRAQGSRSGGGVLVVALDGHGASGKSTLAEHLQRLSGAAVVHTDDFFRPGGPMVGGDLTAYYDLARLRTEALEPLRAGRDASFRPYDWSRGALASPSELVAVGACEVVLLDGVCSAAPAIGDLVDRAVFVDTPEPERLRRLRESVDPAEWDEDWLAAEVAYFARLRPPGSFDLVVSGSGEVVGPEGEVVGPEE